jgi:hypothetical protein
MCTFDDLAEFDEMDLLGMTLRAERKNAKITLLHRPKGQWHKEEVSRLVRGLNTSVCEHPLHPEYLILFGHYTKEKTLEVMLGGVAYTAKQVLGYDNQELPWVPTFI